MKTTLGNSLRENENACQAHYSLARLDIDATYECRCACTPMSESLKAALLAYDVISSGQIRPDNEIRRAGYVNSFFSKAMQSWHNSPGYKYVDVLKKNGSIIRYSGD